MLSVSEIHFIHIDEIETSSSLNHDKVGKSSKIFDPKSSNGEVKNSFFFNLNVGFLDRKNHTFRTE
jgi:hypothetical protein